MGSETASREELLDLLHAAIDGVDGYECECGYLRYWNENKIARAREVLTREYRKPTMPQAERGGSNECGDQE
jgi:hypothetical protein